MRHDEVLAKEKAFTETVLDEQLDSILVYESATGKAIRWNKTFREMSGYTDEEIAGLTAPDAYLDRGDPARAAAAVASTPVAAPLQAERSLICKDGRKIVIECRESFIQGASGMQHYILCVGRDITGRKKIEAELELHRDHLEALVSFRTSELSEAKKAAEAASRAKSEFLAQMSHEIRTPMNAIVGAAQLIENEPLTRRQRDYAEIMRHSSQVLLSLINDILDISKIEAAQISLHAAPFDLGAMLDDTLRAASVLAAKKDLEIVLNLAVDVPRLLVGDMKRLEQILTNLLSNAIKFTNHGSISLRVQQADARAGAVRLSFAVADTGIGIPPEQLDSIFDPFMQVDSGTTRRQGGIGLGLAISRQLAELMDGALEVRSVLGQGSEFSFTALFRLPSATERDAVTALSAGRNPDSDERPPSASPLAGRRVLVIEDNHFNRIVLEGALQYLGIEVDLAIDGHDGVESFRIGQPYDAILVDLHMPGLDGFGCTRAIRALPEGRAVPILAVTANVLSTTAAQCCAAGMNAHLVKPVEPEILRHALMHWILGQRAAIQAKATPENGEVDRLPDVLPGLDRARASGWSNGSARTLAALLDLAFAHSGDDPEKLARYIAAGDVEAAAQITHDLMAVAATVGASALVALARQLNREIRAGSMNSMPANAAVESIGVAFAQLRATRELLRPPLAKG